METFKTNTEDPNYIAFEMLEEKDTEHDIIWQGESLLERLHA